MNRFSVFPTCAISLAMAVSSAAHAQGPRALEEVIVNAQKKDESLQNVPISMSVVSARNIQDINAFDFQDLEEVTPGINFGGGAGLQSVALRIRGVGPEFFALGTPPNIAVFVDQVAQSQIGAVFSTLVDIERVELLRGPQGTLYGRNAPGGAYNITTKNPNYDGVNGYVEGTYSLYESTDFGSQDLRGAVNIPLIDDKLALRIAAVISESDGHVELANPEANEDTTGGKDDKSIRAKLLWQPTENLEALWTLNYQDLEQNPGGFNYDGLLPGTGGTEASPVPAIYNDFDERKNYGTRRSLVTGDLKDTSLHLTWDADIFQIDALALYQEFDTFSDEDREPYPGGVSKFQITADTELTTLELRISNTGDMLDYVGGVYYFDTTFDAGNEIFIQGVDVIGANVLTTEGYALFGNVNWHISPEWDLAVGLRYDDVEDNFTTSTRFLAVDASIDDAKLQFDDISWSFKLRHYLSEDLTAYLAVDRAFKQGGFNGLVAGVEGLREGFGLAVPPVVEQAAADTLTYDEETAEAIELGIKGTFLDSRLSLGAAIFYQSYDNHQVAQTNQSVDALGFNFTNFFLAAIANAEEVKTRGIEFDFVYLLGDHWELSQRAAYAKPTVQDWSTRFCPSGENTTSDQLYCPLSGGDALNNLPQWNFNTQLGYRAPLHDSWEVYSRASWTWESAPEDTKITNDFSESTNRLGFTLGFTETSIGLDIKIWGKNLTDEDLNIDPGRKRNGDNSLPFAFQGSHTEGREYGVTVRYEF